ncbi:DNA polymerase eta isoform X2 [Impatiens glandulifera]|uniref:DNA polymerase eta isoform X2 n=1 Tax=Impatiens glandulifera TaxID=253017 RepID=UPI001FB1965F|nr:DNA polymerase eta isoform X2 [Impatiens glandulifera]
MFLLKLEGNISRESETDRMPVARPESSIQRVIAHIDMDCFYVQVEQRKQPHLRGQPTAVVQYNAWKGGGLIAVSYEARKHGVKRSMRGDDAKRVCPEIQMVQVPVNRGKADLTIYRNAGSEAVSILATKGRCERASIDEVYLDLTEAAEAMLAETPPDSLDTIDEEALKSHVLGIDKDGDDANEKVKAWLRRHDADHNDKLLACGAIIVAEIRMQVLKETEFTCSAGIAHNKMLAKLTSGMNKPAQQTIVPTSSVQGLLESFPIKKMKQLGGKLGSSLQTDLGINTVGDLLKFTKEKLQECYGVNSGSWLWNIARGICGEEVEGRLLPKSHGSGKLFSGPQALKTIASVEHWLNSLCEELNDRLSSDLDQNKRIAHTLTLHARASKLGESDSDNKFPSKSCPLRYGAAKIKEDALNLFQSGLREYLGSFRRKVQGHQTQTYGWRITSLSVSASKIVAIPSGTCSITKYFSGQDQLSKSLQSNTGLIQEVTALSPTGNESNEELTDSKADETHFGEDLTTMYLPPCLHPEDHEREVCQNEETSGVVQTNIQDPPYDLSKNSEDEPNQGTREMPLLAQPKDVSREVNGMSYKLKDPKQRNQKRKMTNEGSILRFFQNSSSSSSSATPIEGVSPNRNTTPSMARSTQQSQHQDPWSYEISEIDPAIIDELPPEIQEEIKGLIRSNNKRVNSSQGIPHYFLPQARK